MKQNMLERFELCNGEKGNELKYSTKIYKSYGRKSQKFGEIISVISAWRDIWMKVGYAYIDKMNNINEKINYHLTETNSLQIN